MKLDFRYATGRVRDSYNLNQMIGFLEVINNTAGFADDLPDHGISTFRDHSARFGKINKLFYGFKNTLAKASGSF